MMEHRLSIFLRCFMPSYYATLGIRSNATYAEIKKAFRTLAKKYHPDKNQGKTIPEYEAIHKANEILADPEKRAKYDSQFDFKQEVKVAPVVAEKPKPQYQDKKQQPIPKKKIKTQSVFIAVPQQFNLENIDRMLLNANTHIHRCYAFCEGLSPSDINYYSNKYSEYEFNFNFYNSNAFINFEDAKKYIYSQINAKNLTEKTGMIIQVAVNPAYISKHENTVMWRIEHSPTRDDIQSIKSCAEMKVYFPDKKNIPTELELIKKAILGGVELCDIQAHQAPGRLDAIKQNLCNLRELLEDSPFHSATTLIDYALLKCNKGLSLFDLDDAKFIQKITLALKAIRLFVMKNSLDISADFTPSEQAYLVKKFDSLGQLISQLALPASHSKFEYKKNN